MESDRTAPTNTQASQPNSKSNGNDCENIEDTTHKDIDRESGINIYANTRATRPEDQQRLSGA